MMVSRVIYGNNRDSINRIVFKGRRKALTLLIMVVALSFSMPATTYASEPFIRGDVNQDVSINIADVISLLSYLSGSLPIACRAAADADDDGEVDIVDVVYLLSHIFAQNPSVLPDPTTCGADPTDIEPGDCLAVSC